VLTLKATLELDDQVASVLVAAYPDVSVSGGEELSEVVAVSVLCEPRLAGLAARAG
jgi:hypothetical protein